MSNSNCSTSCSSSSSSEYNFQATAEQMSSVSLNNESMDQFTAQTGNGGMGPLGMPPKSDKRRTFR